MRIVANNIDVNCSCDSCRNYFYCAIVVHLLAHFSYDGRRLLWGLLIITQIIGLVTEILACLDSHCADFPSSYEVIDV